jgi:hypothetical protein
VLSPSESESELVSFLATAVLGKERLRGAGIGALGLSGISSPEPEKSELEFFLAFFLGWLGLAEELDLEEFDEALM